MRNRRFDDQRFNKMFLALIDSMTDREKFNRDYFVSILRDLSEFFCLSKGVTEFYESLSDEKKGQGEILIDYNKGAEDAPVMSRRIVTPNHTVIKSTLYKAKGTPPLTAEEEKHLDIVLRSLLSFISRNRLERDVSRLAFFDDFGYPNITSFMRFVEPHIESGLDGYTVLMYNLRHFTLVNKEIGRSSGDVVMKNHFEMMKNATGEDGFVCRMGGDNFLMIFKNEHTDDVLKIINGVPVVYDNKRDKRIMVSACAGVFVIPPGFTVDKPADILGTVYNAAQSAKQEETGTVVFNDGTPVPEEKEKSMRIRRLFPEAMASGEFKAYYQPKVNTLTGEIVGAEALCRWIRNGEMVMPMDFIPVLEQTTEICRLDFRILDIVCSDIRRWLDQGIKAVRISVNLSRKHLLDVDVLDNLLRIIDEHRVPHEYLEFELTETTSDVGLNNLKRIITGLRKEGICTTVDDFGTGYSSLNLIRELPWDVMKLDKCFLPVDEGSDRDISSLMYRHVASMARDMGLECVTEGVETRHQIDILRENKIPVAQGFFFDRPLPVDEFEKRLKMGNYSDKL